MLKKYFGMDLDLSFETISLHLIFVFFEEDFKDIARIE